jgi:hypothetical protein
MCIALLHAAIQGKSRDAWKKLFSVKDRWKELELGR